VVIEQPAGSTHFWSLDFRPDGTALIMATTEGRLALADAASGQTRMLPQGEGRARKVAFHPDGRRLAVVSERGGKLVAEIRETDDPRPAASIDVPTQIGHIACSPDGRYVALAGHAQLYVWEHARPGSKLRVLSGQDLGDGLMVAFNHRGDLLVSVGWDGLLRLWDLRTGRQLMGLPILASYPRFSADDRFLGCGRSGQSLQTLEVAAGRELMTLPVDRWQDTGSECLSIAPGGRVLAASAGRGVQLWDLERGDLLVDAGLRTASVHFEADGSLLTFLLSGPLRWPARLDGHRFNLGPPRSLGGASSYGGKVVSNRDGRVVVAVYFHQGTYAFLRDRPNRPIHLGPQADVRSAAVSPDGHWAATCSWSSPSPSVFVWDLETGRRVTALDVAGMSEARFSPSGRSLVTISPGACKLWEVGTWRLAREVATDSWWANFSPDGDLLAVCSRDQVQLYDPAAGRRIATLESPEQSRIGRPCFSPDGRRLAVRDALTRSVLVWDLGLIRSELVELGLDWDAPPLRVEEPLSPTTPAGAALEVSLNYGFLAAHLEQLSEPAEVLVARHSARLKANPDDVEALHQRGHALRTLRRYDEALADFTAALARRADDSHLRAYRGVCFLDLKRFGPALDELERVLRTDVNTLRAIGNFPIACNNLAWRLATGPVPERSPAQAVRLALLAIALAPDESVYINTLGAALFRAGQYREAVRTLEKSLEHGQGQSDAFDLFFLAMSRHKLGQAAEARADLDRALRWRREHPNPPQRGWSADLDKFEAEAEELFNAPLPALPANPFAPDQPG
jgi:WD40 repeat protein/tetratricopeptide (TPR) repeat protein